MPLAVEDGVIANSLERQPVSDSMFIQDALRRYHFRVQGGRAHNQDTQHYMQWRWIESMLNVVDMVLEDNDIPEDVRRRVTTQIIYGGPDPSQAEERVAAREREIKDLMARPLLGVDRALWQAPRG